MGDGLRAAGSVGARSLSGLPGTEPARVRADAGAVHGTGDLHRLTPAGAGLSRICYRITSAVGPIVHARCHGFEFHGHPGITRGPPPAHPSLPSPSHRSAPAPPMTTATCIKPARSRRT